MADVVYLDNNATTRPLDGVVEAMLPFLREEYANPSSIHQFGQSARHRVECARAQVAELVHADPKEIVFTAGGTESINLAIRGTLAAMPAKRHLVTSTVEHSAVRKLAAQLVREGYRVDEVGVDSEGDLDYGRLEAELADDTALVSTMHANNETGVCFDVERIAAIAGARGVRVHLDAVQAGGKLPIDLRRLPVQLVSLSAHKMHGPKGVGALYVRKRTRLSPLMLGGTQERDLRAGTENVAGIVGFGAAAAEADPTDAKIEPIRKLRDEFERRVLAAAPIARVNGAGAPRVCNTTNIGFRRLEAEAILILLSERGVCASAGSACSSGSLEPSHVLQAMGIDPELAHGAVRFSLSRFTTPVELDRAIEAIQDVVARLAPMSSACAANPKSEI